MTKRLPRDRWIGASPGGNVTPGGKALEAVDLVRDYLAGRKDDRSPEVRAAVADLSAILERSNVE